MEENQEVEFEQSENSKGIGYKIEAGREYTVHRQDYNGKIFYSIPVQKKEPDGTTTFAKKQVSFKSGVELEDKTRIKVLSGFEDFYFKRGDKYTPIFKLFITEFEVTKQPEKVVNEAYNEFNNNNGDFQLPW